jgi:hypothetical protein
MNWDATPLLVIIAVVNLVALIRGYIMITTVLRSMSGHFEGQGGAKFLIAHNALNNISDFLEYRYKQKSAEEQHDVVVKMISDYSEKMQNLMEGKNAANKEGV